MIKKSDKEAYERYLSKLDTIRQYNNVRLGETEVEKKKRIQRAKTDYEFCAQYYFPHYCKSESAPFQIEAANYILQHPTCIDVECWHRGGAKSTHMDIIMPFYLWINQQINVLLLVGKTQDDANTLLSDLQAEFEANPQIIADFGEQHHLGHWEAGNFVTKNGVAFFSLGRGQSPRGIRYRNKRPNVIIIDDIDDDEIAENQRRVKKVVKWLFGALYGTMDNEGSRFIFANNLISNTGIIAHVIEHVKGLMAKGMKTARINMVPAIAANGLPSWPGKYTIAHFNQLREIIGDYAFQTEYQNNPQVEGKLFLDEQIQWATLPDLKTFEAIVGHWDVAYAGTPTADYNAIRVWGLKSGKFYLICCYVKQSKMAPAIRWMIEQEQLFKKQEVRVIWQFESQFWNDALKMIFNEVCNDMNYILPLVKVERSGTNKFVRIVSTLQPLHQSGKCYYNIAEKQSMDMQVGNNQLKGIEPGYSGHDDAPDADEAAISYLQRLIPSNNPLPIIGRRKERDGLW